MIVEWIAAALIVVGAAFSLLAAVGLLRMPDVYMRIQAAAKSTTLGVSSLVLAMALLSGAMGVSMRALLVAAFLLLTAPVAAQVIGRAAYINGQPLWRRSIVDELQSNNGNGRGRSDADEQAS